MRNPGKELLAIVKDLQGVKGCLTLGRVETEDVVVNCPDSLAVYTATVALQGTWRDPIDVQLASVRRIEVLALPDMRRLPGVSKTETGFRIAPEGIVASGANLVQIKVAVRIAGDAFVEAMVRRDIEREALGPDRNEYWMSAQLRDLSWMDAKLGPFDLRDVDFHLNVAVHQDIKDTIPKPFIKELELISRWINEPDHHKRAQIDKERTRFRAAGVIGEEADILDSIQEMFLPSKFSEFVEVRRDFRFSDVRRGTEFYDRVPYRTFPKVMDVISRTDLSADNPAAEGVLTYRRSDFQSELSELIPDLLKRAKAYIKD